MGRVLVCGSRAYNDQARLHSVLDGIHRFGLTIESVVEGGATGADQFAREWAAKMGIRCFTVRAQWARFGRRAGPIRNSHMLSEYLPDLVVAFPGGNGTQDMIDKARKVGVEVLLVAAASTQLENSHG